MVDRRLLVTKDAPEVRMVEHSYGELKQLLGEYGLQFELSNSCLLDALPADNDMVIQPLISQIFIFQVADSSLRNIHRSRRSSRRLTNF